MKKIIVLLVFATIAQAQSPTGDAKKGKDVYVKFGCYGCHDYSGQGGTGAATGPRLIGLSMTQSAFTAFLRSPTRPVNMPPYTAKVMTDAQATDLYAYIKTFPPSPAAKDIPLLNQIMNESK